MKKFLACLLALPLALAACGAQTADTASTPAESAQTTETAPETSTPAVATMGRLRDTSMMMAVGNGVYTVNEKWNDENDVDTFYLVRTDYDTTTQQKVAEIELPGGAYYGMVAWDDMVKLYLFETPETGEPIEWCYTIDTATGSMERQTVDNNFWPAWCDDAAMYEMNYDSNAHITRIDRRTGETSRIELPQQTENLHAVGDKWLLERIVSPSPLPSMDDGDMYNAVLQNSEREYDILDTATGEMQKLYSYPAVGEAYYYCGQREGTLYFYHYTQESGEVYPSGVTRLENGEMVQVLALENEHIGLHAMEDEAGELQWIAQENGKKLEVYDLNDGQTYRPAFKVDHSTYATTGYPQMLLPGGRVLVLNGNIDAPGFADDGAYAAIDRAAYLAGGTDYTPVAMYTGE